MYPTRTAATGLGKGTSDSASDADAAQTAIVSGMFSRSYASTYAVSCVSRDQPEAMSGRMGLSGQLPLMDPVYCAGLTTGMALC